MSRIAAVVVTHNSARWLSRCLEAAVRFCDTVIVVDNASRDSTAEVAARFPVQLLCNSANRGFAAAANQGVALSSEPLILLLNPDVELATPLAPLVEACRQGAAVATGLLVDARTREPQRGFTLRRFPTAWSLVFEVLGINRLWPSNPVNRAYRCLDVDLSRPAHVEQPPGAFFLVQRSAWEALGGMDERFWPLWFEDVDFLRRAALAGLAIRYVPEVWAYHWGGHSVQQLDAAIKIVWWYASLLTYVWKHFRPGHAWAISLAILIGVAGRTVWSLAGRREVGSCQAYINVFRQTCRSLLRRAEPSCEGRPHQERTRVNRTSRHNL